MKSKSFSTIILVVFGVLAVIAVLIFSGAIPIGKKSNTPTGQGTVVIWGPYPRDIIIRQIEDFNRTNKTYTITYIQANQATLNADLTEAVASGTGPDLVIIPQSSIVAMENKLYHIPYESLPQRTFLDTYTQEGSLFLAPDGVVGLPLTIDPMIMYYNRNLFEGAGFTTAPQTWDEVRSEVPALTKKDGNGNVIQSAMAFGSYANISHAKDILSMLFMQAGTEIVGYDSTGYISKLSDNKGFPVSPAESSLSFYTEFANPTSAVYSWSKAMPNSQNAFLSEQLAVYFGYASELPLLSAKNPNLNFDIAKVPQIKNSNVKMTFGNMYGIAIVKASRNLQTALIAATQIADKSFAEQLTKSLLEIAPIAPARRDLLATAPQTLYGPTLYGSALIARGWLDPGETKSSPVFATMVDDVLRGALSVGQAVSQANNRLNLTLE